jgi:hypothetical protein
MQLEWFAILIPLVAVGVLLGFFRDRIVWWEIALLLGASVLVLAISRLVLVNLNTSDTEYLGSYIVRVEYDEPWSEWVSQTCTRECCCTVDSKGVKSCGSETYDCSHEEYHSAQWRKVNQLGEETSIDKQEYEALCAQFAQPRQFVELGRASHEIDGDRYVCHWGGERERLSLLTKKHRYENKIQASRSLFHLQAVKPQVLTQYKLYDYPAITGQGLQPAVLSLRPIPYRLVRPYDELNALLGVKKQVRVFVLLFENQPREAAIWQRHYWEGGNKNELVVCIGLNQQQAVTWCDVFSWETTPMAEIKIRDLFLHQGQLNLVAAAPEVERIVTQHWQRKAFADFAYLQVSLTQGQLIGVYVLIILLSLGLSTWAVVNDSNPDSGEPPRWEPYPGRRRR